MWKRRVFIYMMCTNAMYEKVMWINSTFSLLMTTLWIYIEIHFDFALTDW